MPEIQYAPYVDVASAAVRRALYRVAEVMQFLDKAFAMYFLTVVPPSTKIENDLKFIRESIHSRQAADKKYVGALGEYMEKLHEKKITLQPRTVEQNGFEAFRPRDFGDHALAYLQDGFEAPYWCLLAEIFIQSCLDGKNDNTSISFVLRVVNDTQRELHARVQKIKYLDPGKLPKEIEDGIDRRVNVLDRLLEEITERFDQNADQQLQVMQQSAINAVTHPLHMAPVSASGRADTPQPILQPQTETLETDMAGATELERASQSFLFLVFLTIAMVPAFVGFSRHFNDAEAVGSFSEPDYAWMWSNFLLAVLGNLYAVIPLFKVTRGSWGYRLTWFLICLSTIWGILSVATYATLNKAWTSMFGFLNSFFAVASVFASTQQVSRKATNDMQADGSRKVKEE